MENNSKITDLYTNYLGHLNANNLHHKRLFDGTQKPNLTIPPAGNTH